MSLHERITAHLDGTTPGPWLVAGHGDVIEAKSGYHPVCRDGTGDNARLIAAAPSLLAECARRLDPGREDVRDLVMRLRHLDEVENERDACQWGASGYYVLRAADLLAQVFLDPQETT